MKYIGKGILTLVLLGVLVFIALIAGFIVSAINGAAYIAIVAAMAVALAAFTVMQIWGILKPKLRYILAGGLLAFAVLSIPVIELYKAYDNSIDRVDQEVNLWDYEPFAENTKAVSLDETSTLKLTDNLPRLDGATALYPLYSAFTRTVYPEGKSDYRVKEDGIVDCSNTIGAYEKLISGEKDIIFVAGPSEQQLQMAKNAGVELKLTPIGVEAFVFFVNANNPVNGLSTDDIRKIYSGKSTNWKEFGGKNARIRAFQRTENSGSQTALVNMMGNIPLMTPPKEDVVSMMGGMISVVSSYRNYNNALGYSFLFYATEMSDDNKIKLLSIDGVAPTRENVANRTYPHSSEFYAVTAGSGNPNVERLIEWILSEQGQYLVRKTGYTPLGRD